MTQILHRVFDQALHLADALDDLVAEAALGFAAAAPMIAERDNDAAAKPCRAAD